MKKDMLRLTTAQFAKLHHVNKRTLHYYDDIGLFSPKHKGENGYRYYDYSQSIDFEYIRVLRDIHLHMGEIKELVYSFDDQKFWQIAEDKQKEIAEEIERLRKAKAILSQKQKHFLLCQRVKDMDIEILTMKKEHLLTVSYNFEEDDFMKAFQYAQSVWPPEQCRAGVGSYISLEKIRTGRFETYDGLFSPMLKEQKGIDVLLKPEGRYLCGYIKGSWSRLPELYGRMLDYAQRCELNLKGYAFEYEINDFVIAEEEENITQVAIQIENPV